MLLEKVLVVEGGKKPEQKTAKTQRVREEKAEKESCLQRQLKKKET